MRARVLVGLLGLCALVAACGSPTRPAAPGSLRIQKLSGSVAKPGSFDGYPLYGVRLVATVCDTSSKAVYPDEIRVTHFVVSGSRKEWWPARRVVDRAPWLVPLGETWGGKPCGKVLVDDPIPPQHYDAVGLGNPYSCYGVALTIKDGTRRASKRAIIQCGGIGIRTCSPDEVVAPPSVVGQVKRVAVKHLHDAGFRVTVFPQLKPNTTVPAGVVVRQEPGHNLSVCKGSDIWLVVSIGKK